jgi:hypothetical protein
MDLVIPTNQEQQARIEEQLAYAHTGEANASTQNLLWTWDQACALAADLNARVRNPIIATSPALQKQIDMLAWLYLERLFPLLAELKANGVFAAICEWTPDLTPTYAAPAEPTEPAE